MMDTETRKVIAMMLVILEQMSRNFVYSRRMKDLRELETQHEATVSESATDKKKFRLHSEFKGYLLGGWDTIVVNGTPRSASRTSMRDACARQ